MTNNMKFKTEYVKLLEDIIACAEEELNYISKKHYSKWNEIQLQNVVLPEMRELLLYARNGRLFFKYGKKQRQLESTYMVTDSFEKLNMTILGRMILDLQKIYNTL